MQASNGLKLEKPGAGLPKFELLIVRIGFKIYRSLKKESDVLQKFQSENSQITNLVDGVDPEKLKQQTLIKRFPGIEDSSRNWSVFMTVQHLNIVNSGIAELIGTLLKNENHQKEVKIENVKPSKSAGKEVISEFSIANKKILDLFQQEQDFKIQSYHPHPWFGPLNPWEWLCLTAIHQGIHRKQIETILTNNSI